MNNTQFNDLQINQGSEQYQNPPHTTTDAWEADIPNKSSDVADWDKEV